MTEADFVRSLVDEAPEIRDLIDVHLRDQSGELLLHLLVADVRRVAVDAFQRGDGDLLRRLLDLLDRALREGDELVENAVAVSFVEDTGWWEPAMRPFIDAWPAALRAEALRQQSSDPPRP
ncbi:MAG: hypothetical protein AB1673_06145 [Actinomycetota bacterium]